MHPHPVPHTHTVLSLIHTQARTHKNTVYISNTPITSNIMGDIISLQSAAHKDFNSSRNIQINPSVILATDVALDQHF